MQVAAEGAQRSPAVYPALFLEGGCEPHKVRVWSQRPAELPERTAGHLAGEAMVGARQARKPRPESMVGGRFAIRFGHRRFLASL